MDRQMAFNEDAANYDKWRPRYCDALFKDVIRYAGLVPGMHAVEVGCGTGQATRPILETGCRVTAVELGDQLAAFAWHALTGAGDFQVENLSFEEYQCAGESVDLVYAATSFHWIPEETGYPKAYRMLKPGGTLALFWNAPYYEDTALDQALQAVYARYTAAGRFTAAKTLQARVSQAQQDRCREKEDTIRRYGFVDLETHFYSNTRSLANEDTLSLLDTYSDHRAMAPEDRTRMYGEIRDLIRQWGDRIEIRYTMDLYLARKPE